MDKEKLMSYFKTHYLSRQDVLFKLPFSIKIESFWSELMNQRKAKATLLPLFDGTGKPYWFVLTDKMIQASEHLCAEAMNQPDGFDPYRAPVTSTMLEEMIYTSYVEGAQISLDAALDFLRRGTEPENIQEQMIWNNCQAWSMLMKALYKPLDETYVHSLAYALTDEMEGRAEGYRQTDYHPIAAMNDEPYNVPSAMVLSERMQDFYAYLRLPDVHPLIKASVGQAYLLVARPFTEGNERLSRMISSFLLLRSGYDFLRDISISAMIARDTFHYYKAMQEILRAENGGDLTYFIEYYLDLLSRAVLFKQEKDKQKTLAQQQLAQAEIEKERTMAKQPLMISAKAEPPAPTQKPSALPNTSLLKQLIKEGSAPEKRLAAHLLKMVAAHVTTFTLPEWEKGSERCRSVNQQDLRCGIELGLLKRDSHTYILCLSECQNGSISHVVPPTANKQHVTDAYSEMKDRIQKMLHSSCVKEVKAARILLDFMHDRIYSFNFQDWSHRSKLPHSTGSEYLRMALNLGILRKEAEQYIICRQIDQEARFHVLSPKQHEIRDKLYERFADQKFHVDEASKKLSISRNALDFAIHHLIQRGIVKKGGEKSYQSIYMFTNEFKQSMTQKSTAGAVHRSAMQPLAMAAARA